MRVKSDRELLSTYESKLEDLTAKKRDIQNEINNTHILISILKERINRPAA